MANKVKEALPLDREMIVLCRNQPEAAAQILNQCLEEGNIERLLAVLRQFAKACGTNGLDQGAEWDGCDIGQTLATLRGMADIMGARLAFVPKKNPPASS